MRANFLLSPEQRADARSAIDLLGGKMSLASAATLALSVSGKRIADSATIDQAGARFVSAKISARKRPKTVSWYGEMLAVFSDGYGSRPMESITRSELLAWIDTRSAGSRPHFLRVIRALFRWAASQDPPLLTDDPTRGLRVEVEPREHSVQILTVEQSGRLLAGDARHRAAHALALFAGLRPEEIAGKGKPWLPWAAINEAERMIRVPAECAKTRRTRIIEGLPDALWCWLASIPAEQRGATVALSQSQRTCRTARAVLGLARWPQDVLRHTFATYAVALTSDAAKVSLWLGHEGSTALIHRHYRGLATKAQAEAFFALRP